MTKHAPDEHQEAPDGLVPDPVVMKEFGINNMTLWRWDQNPKIGFPPKVKIGLRNYRSRAALEAFKAMLIRKAVAAQDARYKRYELTALRRKWKLTPRAPIAP
jgi:predicted DNA-binding transcriptional regulator AlpA